MLLPAEVNICKQTGKVHLLPVERELKVSGPVTDETLVEMIVLNVVRGRVVLPPVGGGWWLVSEDGVTTVGR